MNPEILQAISEAVENAVETKINGKLRGISAHLVEQDATLTDLKELLEDKKFLVQLWAFIKFLGGIIMATGTAVLLWKKLRL